MGENNSSMSSLMFGYPRLNRFAAIDGVCAVSDNQRGDRKENSESAEQICWLAIVLLLFLFARYSLILQHLGIYNAEFF